VDDVADEVEAWRILRRPVGPGMCGRLIGVDEDTVTIEKQTRCRWHGHISGLLGCRNARLWMYGLMSLSAILNGLDASLRNHHVAMQILATWFGSLPSSGGDLGEEIEFGTYNGYFDVEHLCDDLCPPVKEVDPSVNPRDFPRRRGASLVEKD